MLNVRSLTSGEKFEAYAHRADPLMLALAIVFLGIWSLASLWSGIPPRLDRAFVVVEWAIWGAFVADLVIRSVIAKSSWSFILHHPLEVLAVVVPMLRPLRMLTILASGARVVTSRGLLRAGQAIIASALLLIWVAGVAMYNVEADAPGAHITNFPDALWWALVTITTVGYGDLYPVTVEGRVVAGGLMVVGVAVLGVVTATVATWFLRVTSAQERQDAEDDAARLDRDSQALSAKVEALEAKIDRLLEQRPKTRR